MERAAGCQSAGVCNLALELLGDENSFSASVLAATTLLSVLKDGQLDS